MDRTAVLRLPPLLEHACARVREAAAEAARQTVDSLGLAAMSCGEVLRRDALRAAQYELSRKVGLFAQAFNEALDTAVARQFGLLQATPLTGVTPDALMASWESMSLVDDREMELHLSAERLTQVLAHHCEWELREFTTYMATLMGRDDATPAGNPLRPEIVGNAVMQGVDAVSGRPEVRSALVEEIGRTLAGGLRQCYAALVADLRGQGVQPVGLAVRQSTARRPADPPPDTAPQPLPDPHATTRPALWSAPGPTDHGHAHGRAHGRVSATTTGRGASTALPPGAATRPPAHRQDLNRPLAANTRVGQLDEWPTAPGQPDFEGTPLGGVDPGVMQLLRRLAAHDPMATRGQPAARAAPAAGPSGPAAPGGAVPPGGASATARPGAMGSTGLTLGALQSVNQISAHRDALRAAAANPLDHLIIDLVAGLFDQILSDRRVPPQFARELARLQMPVLRAALGDSAFFASRRHPVRRFVNRIASLAAACGDATRGPGAALLDAVATCVQAIVDGDFDQAEVYEQQLEALDRHVADQARAEVQALGDADELLARKEREVLAAARFAQVVDDALAPLPVPDHLRRFIRGIWSRVIARVSFKDGADSPLARHLRAVGRDLVMSVQPKGDPQLREGFVRSLPPLMKALKLGLDHGRVPEADRQAFFGQLLPAHAQALKQNTLTVLDHNLLAREVEAVFALPIPGAVGLATPDAADLQSLSADAQFTPGEAAAVGWVSDSSLELDLDLSAPTPLAADAADHAVGHAASDNTVPLRPGTVPGDTAPTQRPSGAAPSVGAAEAADGPVTQVDLLIDGLPEPEAPEPTRGVGLVEHLNLGFGYLMQLQGRWEEVRLSHITPGRGFFVFTHGQGQRQTVSMTHRMLVRLCEADRLRMLEPALLLDRATARVRRQLAQLVPLRA